MRSIQRRLSVGLFAVLLVVGLVLAQTGLWLFDQGLRRYFAGNLREEAENLLVAMVRGPNGMQLDEQRLNPAFQRPYSGRYFVIELEKDTWRSRSLWDSELEVPHKKGLVQGLVDGPEEQRLLVFRGHYKRMGQKLRIVVAQDYTPILESFARVQWMGLGAGALALLLVLLLQRLTVRRSLRPLEEVRLQIAQLQQGQRSQLDNQAPEELEPLVEQINHLLAHTEETLKRSRNALGNLGHALKTPLAVLVSLAEREEMARQPELQQVLREQLEQIQQRLGRELGKARLVGEALPGAHFDCAEELPSLCDTLRLIHGPHLQVSWSAPPGLRLPWDREDLLEMLGNLLDNACKWADSEVRLTVAQGEGMVRLEVDDDGPGILPDQRQAVLERGTRLDEQVSGHGLGLGIARDIAEACGGRLSLEDSPLGGLRVSIELSLQKSEPRRQGLTVLHHLPTVPARFPPALSLASRASCKEVLDDETADGYGPLALGADAAGAGVPVGRVQWTARGGAVAAVTRAGSLRAGRGKRVAQRARQAGTAAAKVAEAGAPARLRGWLRSLARLAIWGTYGPPALFRP